MTLPHQEWLLALGNRRADFIGSNGAIRGEAISHNVIYPGDLTTATLTGEVKAAPDSPTALLTFTIGTPVFADGKTTWPVSIAEGWTFPADTDADGVEYGVYTFLLAPSGGSAQTIAGGLFQVIGFITEPA